jgi:acetyltransferase-like isoleucine patch superfamily enzyme
LRSVKSEKVILEAHSVVLAGSLMLPGARLLEGSVLGSQSTLNKVSDKWTIYLGNPARAVKKRKKYVDTQEK